MNHLGMEVRVCQPSPTVRQTPLLWERPLAQGGTEDRIERFGKMRTSSTRDEIGKLNATTLPFPGHALGDFSIYGI